MLSFLVLFFLCWLLCVGACCSRILGCILQINQPCYSLNILYGKLFIELVHAILFLLKSDHFFLLIVYCCLLQSWWWWNSAAAAEWVVVAAQAMAARDGAVSGL